MGVSNDSAEKWTFTDYGITSVNGSSKVLDAYIDNMDKSLLNKVSRFLHISMK